MGYHRESWLGRVAVRYSSANGSGQMLPPTRVVDLSLEIKKELSMFLRVGTSVIPLGKRCVPRNNIGGSAFIFIPPGIKNKDIKRHEDPSRYYLLFT